MTIRQIYLSTAYYVILFAVVAVLTRATPKRIAGALAGGGAVGPAMLGIIVLCERAGWWHFVFYWDASYLIQMAISVVLGTFVFLLTWRLARRFGGRGLAIALILAAVLGPFRDSWYMAKFPEWGYYAPGILPILAISLK